MNELTNEKLYDVIAQWKAICQKDGSIPMNWIVKEACR